MAKLSDKLNVKVGDRVRFVVEDYGGAHDSIKAPVGTTGVVDSIVIDTPNDDDGIFVKLDQQIKGMEDYDHTWGFYSRADWFADGEAITWRQAFNYHCEVVG